MKTVLLYLIVILNDGSDYELRRIISYEDLTCSNWYEKNIKIIDNKFIYNNVYVNGYICQ